MERVLNVENGLEFEPQPCRNKQADTYTSKCDSQLSLNSVLNVMSHACHLMTYGTVALQEDAVRLYDSDHLVAFEMFLHSHVYLTLLYLRGNFFLKLPSASFFCLSVLGSRPCTGRVKALDSCPHEDVAMTCL